MKKYLTELYKRKDLLLYLVTSGLKAQHKNSFLGYFWWLLDPLLNVVIYYFLVVVLFHRSGENYGVYLAIGLVVWKWLGSTVSLASRSIIAQSGIITQVYLPKAIFPFGVALSELINFAFGLLIIAAFIVFFRVLPGIELLWLPYIIVMQFIFLIAIALLLAFVCVFVRDIDTLVGHIMRIWFYGSPVIWSEDMMPERIHWLLDLNPMTHFLNSFRDILMYHKSPDFIVLAWIGFFSMLIIAAMIYIYKQNEHKIIKAL
jgi:lipopolysaccharide transport system permease protein/teichoic acid transport system permease protein